MSEDGVYRRVRLRRWEAVLPGVYRVSGAPASWHQKAVAACLWAGPGAFVSHRSAAALLRLLPQRREDVVEISIDRYLPPPSGIIVHRARTTASDRTKFLGISVTTPARTLLDLASAAGREEVETALDEALRRGLTSLQRLRRLIERPDNRRRRGVAILRRLVEDRTAGRAPESVLERRLAELLVRAGLPKPVRQFEVSGRDGVIARIDLAYPDCLLAIEADGYAHHAGRLVFQKDRVRANELTRRGWRILRFTWEDVDRRPEAVVAQVGAVLCNFSRA